MPVDRQTFETVRQRVIETAPAGLSREQFDALLDQELAKMEPAQPTVQPQAAGMSDAQWTAMSPSEKAQNVLRWGGNVIAGMTGMGSAGREAVEQQGSRVSDADVKALWLPMVPDAYRDTAESYKLKWDLIDAMRGVEGKASSEADDAYSAYLKRQGAGRAR